VSYCNRPLAQIAASGRRYERCKMAVGAHDKQFY
jgi:hypothetical protein